MDLGLNKKILFRCDGNSILGLGHVTRCINIANKFSNSFEWETFFLGSYNQYAKNIIKSAGHEVLDVDLVNYDSKNEVLQIINIVENFNINVLFFDSRTNMLVADFSKICAYNVFITTLDDPNERRVLTDLAFYPPVQSVHKMDWTKFKGNKFIDWDYYPLSEKIIQNRRLRNYKTSEKPKTICISMGSIDPFNYTHSVLHELLNMNESFEIEIIIGPNNKFEHTLDQFFLHEKQGIRIIKNESDITKVFENADLGLITFGATAYEAACVGLPTMLFPLNKEHFLSANSLVDAGISLHAWPNFPVLNSGLGERIKCLISDVEKLSKMSQKSLNLLDGMGASRIFHTISISYMEWV